MSRRTKLDVQIKVVNMSPTLYRTIAVGEGAKHLGCRKSDIDLAQNAVGREFVDTVTVIGHDPDTDQAVTSLTFEIDLEADGGELAIDPNKNALEQIDKGIGAIVKHAAEQIEAKGLVPRVYVEYRDDFTPEEVSRARDILGTSPSTLDWGEDMEPREIVKSTPGRDPGQSWVLTEAFKKRK